MSTAIDLVVRVDHTVPPVYPNWVKNTLHSDLEDVGPDEYDVAKLKPVVLPRSVIVAGTGLAVYEHVRNAGILVGCLDLRDLEAMEEKGLVHFQKHFRGKSVVALKSVAESDGDCLVAPCLFALEDELVLGWLWLSSSWSSGNIVLYFAKEGENGNKVMSRRVPVILLASVLVLVIALALWLVSQIAFSCLFGC